MCFLNIDSKYRVQDSCPNIFTGCDMILKGNIPLLHVTKAVKLSTCPLLERQLFGLKEIKLLSGDYPI